MKVIRCSLPSRILLILDLWRIITSAERIKLNSISVLDCLNTIINAGSANALIIEATETILTIINTASQTRIDHPNITFKPGILTDKAINTPKIAAMPFPPLNPKNIVQLCPDTQLKPKIMRSISEDKKLTFDLKKSPKKNTAANPLKTSINNTVIPALFPKTRKAFVAPTLPEPNLRISIPFSSLPKI